MSSGENILRRDEGSPAPCPLIGSPSPLDGSGKPWICISSNLISIEDLALIV